MAGLGTVAVIRRDQTDSAYLIPWIRAAGGVPLDVCNWSDVQVLCVSSSGDCELRLAGTPLEGINSVLLSGTPGSGDCPAMSLRERWYRNAERNAALQAALAGAQHTYIVNRGDALSFGRQHVDPLTMLRRLATCGWRTPTLAIGYTTRDDDLAKARALPPPDRSANSPNEVAEKRLVIFSRCGDALMADGPVRTTPENVLAMRDTMQSLLRSLDLDWATVAVGMVKGQIYAFGMRPWLPASLGHDGFARLYRSIKASSAQVLGIGN